MVAPVAVLVLFLMLGHHGNWYPNFELLIIVRLLCEALYIQNEYRNGQSTRFS